MAKALLAAGETRDSYCKRGPGLRAREGRSLLSPNRLCPGSGCLLPDPKARCVQINPYPPPTACDILMWALGCISRRMLINQLEEVHRPCPGGGPVGRVRGGGPTEEHGGGSRLGAVLGLVTLPDRRGSSSWTPEADEGEAADSQMSALDGPPLSHVSVPAGAAGGAEIPLPPPGLAAPSKAKAGSWSSTEPGVQTLGLGPSHRAQQARSCPSVLGSRGGIGGPSLAPPPSRGFRSVTQIMALCIPASGSEHGVPESRGPGSCSVPFSQPVTWQTSPSGCPSPNAARSLRRCRRRASRSLRAADLARYPAVSPCRPGACHPLTPSPTQGFPRQTEALGALL
ncbi:uncharacterized protein ACOB8E_023886 [Sarcophilus harrisii]